MNIINDKILNLICLIGFSVLFYESLCYGRFDIDDHRVSISIVLCAIAFVRNTHFEYNRSIFVFQKRDNIVKKLWLGVIVSMIISYFVRNQIGRYNYILTFVIIYFLYFTIIPEGFETLIIPARASVVAGLYLLYQCISTTPLYFPLYTGIFRNANTMSLSIVGTIISLIYLQELEDNKYVKFFLCCTEFLFIVVLVCSGSRTGIFSVLLGMALSVFYKIQNGKVASLHIIVWIGVISLLAIVFLVNNINYISFLSSIFNKWNNIQRLSSGRFERWISAIQNMTLFGRGEYISSSNQPHNIYVVWLETYGIISAMLYIAFCVWVIIQGINLYTLERNAENFYYIIFFVTQCVINMGEQIFGVFANPLGIISFISVGMIIKRYSLMEYKTEWNFFGFNKI